MVDSCDKVANLLNSYLDGRIDFENAEKVECHISGCSSCMAELDRLRDHKEENTRMLRPVKYGDLTYRFRPNSKVNIDISDE